MIVIAFCKIIRKTVFSSETEIIDTILFMSQNLLAFLYCIFKGVMLHLINGWEIYIKN